MEHKIPTHVLACGVIALCLLGGIAWERYTNAIPPEPLEQQAESVNDDSGFSGDRSGQWPAVRAQFVKHNPKCAACGSVAELNVHHVLPFHTHPELELETDNLITLCRTHHWFVGHDPDGPRGPQKPDWKKSNPSVRRDAACMLLELTK